MMAKQEKEIKLTLLTEDDYKKLSTLLGEPISVENQVNYYLDSLDNKFSTSKSTFRLRLVNDERAFVTFKSRTLIEKGIATSDELEEEESLQLIKSCVHDKANFNALRIKNKVFASVLKTYDISVQDVKVLGSITTLRTKYHLERYQIELDKTDYGFAINYELELEAPDSELVLSKLEYFLSENDIHYRPSGGKQIYKFYFWKDFLIKIQLIFSQ